MKSFFKEFKTFIERGNVLDMAIGVVIGGAFQAIVSSLVNDVLMPTVAIITSSKNFTDLAFTTESGAVIAYGNFIQSIVDFLIVAFVIFIFVKNVNKAKELREAKKKKEEVKEEAPAKSAELVALEEIRDLLKTK